LTVPLREEPAARFFRYYRSPPSTVYSARPYITMIPIFARDNFSSRCERLAWMMGVAGAGAFWRALFLAYLGDFKRKGGRCRRRFWFWSFPDRLAQSTRLVWSLVFLFGVGFTIVTSVRS